MTYAAQRPDIVSESFGSPKDPPILLIMGAMASMLWWPEAFCRQLARRGRFVIRYDNRDTGLSTKYPPGTPPYNFGDMVDDAIRVLDDHGATFCASMPPIGRLLGLPRLVLCQQS